LSRLHALSHSAVKMSSSESNPTEFLKVAIEQLTPSNFDEQNKRVEQV
jgi:hypothetical protein